MKIPWTANSVLRVGAAYAVGATVEDLELADLDDRPLAVLDRAPGTTALAVVLACRCRRPRSIRRAGAGRADGERDVEHGRRVGTAARSRVVVVGDADQGVALQLTGVVGTVRRVGGAAGRVPALQRMSVALAVISTSESSGGPGTPTLTASLMRADEFAAAPFASDVPTVTFVDD